MKYHALFVIFEKVAKFDLSSAANSRLRFKGLLWAQVVIFDKQTTALRSDTDLPKVCYRRRRRNNKSLISK